MKALLLAGATLAAVACASEPSAAVRVPAPKVSPEPEPSTSTAPSTTTTEPAPTTTTAPEPVATTVAEEPTTTAPRPVRTTVTAARPTQLAPVVHVATPPEYVKQCESGGNYRAVNPNGHYGAWQFSQSTWESVGGTGRPDHATPAEQDYRAAILWDNGRGAAHWSCA